MTFIIWCPFGRIHLIPIFLTQHPAGTKLIDVDEATMLLEQQMKEKRILRERTAGEHSPLASVGGHGFSSILTGRLTQCSPEQSRSASPVQGSPHAAVAASGTSLETQAKSDAIAEPKESTPIAHQGYRHHHKHHSSADHQKHHSSGLSRSSILVYLFLVHQ